MNRRQDLTMVCYIRLLLIALFSGLSTLSTTCSDRLTANAYETWRKASLQVARHTNPGIDLSDARDVPTIYSQAAELQQAPGDDEVLPVALASGDFDEDGVPDLISGYWGAHGGIVSLHLGNAGAIYSNGIQAQQQKPREEYIDSPFLPAASVFEVPEAPDFLGAGDFDADGHRDVVVAARGSNKLYLLPGDGRGGFGRARFVELIGRATALATGEINRPDGLTDVVVGVIGPQRASALIFEGPEGAFEAEPESFALPAEPTAIAIGQLDDEYPMDLAVGAGSQVVIIHGRDRRLSLDKAIQSEGPPPVVDAISLPFVVTAIAVGDFAGQHRNSLALLSEDGMVRLLERLDNHQDKQTLRSAVEKQYGEPEIWSINSVVALPQPIGLSAPRFAGSLVRAKVSTRPADDLVVLDHAAHQFHVLTSDASPGLEQNGASNPASSTFRVAASFDVESEPVAVLPMRLNSDALADLVILRKGHNAPTVTTTIAAMTFTVTNTNDSGPGSLRQMILNANAAPGLDEITFHIDGGPLTITPLSALPEITDPVVIDATTQPGFIDKPIVELNGANAGSLVHGLNISGGSTTVRGLVINRFIGGDGSNGSGNGVYLQVNGNSIIEGNFIGTDAAGTGALPNTNHGVSIDKGSSNNIIGGTTFRARNLLSGNGGNGVLVFGSATAGNLIAGNSIGTDLTGVSAVANSLDGINLSAPGNVVGGLNNFRLGFVPRNVVSGNRRFGVVIISSIANGNLVQGNLIGVDVTGNVSLGNSAGGLLIDNAFNNTIGALGTGSVELNGRNIISSNGLGIRITGGSGNNLVQGNFIGTNQSGTAALGNIHDGVVIDGGSSDNTVGGAVPPSGFPGTVSDAGNIISGNGGSGVNILGGSTLNTVEGNFIGIDASSLALGNAGDGVIISNSAQNIVGGELYNVISANGLDGVRIFGLNATRNLVANNRIGTSSLGAGALGNQQRGVEIIDAPGNMIGTTSLGIFNISLGNLISNNKLDGILIQGSAATANTVQGNGIGVNILGNAVSGNGGNGVLIKDAPSNFIGGVRTQSARNVISANSGDGIEIIGSGATGNSVQGNRLAANRNGILIFEAPNSIIGGDVFGAGNEVLDNVSSGIQITGSSGNRVQGNFIGTDLAYQGIFGNGSHGILLNSSPGNIIGGPTFSGVPGVISAAGNVILGNRSYGIFITNGSTGTIVQGNSIGVSASIQGNIEGGNGAGGIFLETPDNLIDRNLISLNQGIGVSIVSADRNRVEGNFIGTGPQGYLNFGNSSQGVLVQGASDNLIGSNVISGNFFGIEIRGSNAIANIVQGNFIGTDVSGNFAIPNSAGGVTISDASRTLIGGTTEQTRNVISGNSSFGGVLIIGSNATDNLVQGNFIGINSAGTAALANSGGVEIAGRSTNNTIGGIGPGMGNVISGNLNAGIFIDVDAPANVVQGNLIGTNAAGTLAIGNLRDGMAVGSPNNTIGGTTAGARNVISANGLQGITLFGSDADGNIVQGNFIGTDSSGTVPLGNLTSGVGIGGSSNTIGGIASSARNVIAFNGNGVFIANGTGNAVLSNSIFSNAGLGIDVAPSLVVGVTPNDPCDGDTGPNNLQNFPVLTSVASFGGNTTIEGTLNSAANTTFNLQFFSNPGCDPSGFGEGKTLIGSAIVTTDSSCSASFTASFSITVPTGQSITATATDSNNNASEFSPCIQVNEGGTPIGNNVTVQLGAVTITFASVSAAGTTTVALIDPSSAGSLPGGFDLGLNPAFDITTTASVTGPILVCFQVLSVNDPAEFSRLRVLHNEGGTLVDRTTDSPAPDFATRTICARVDSLSPFLIARLAGEFDTCLQDDSSGNMLSFSSTTGAYLFTNCAAFTLSGTGSLVIRGGIITLQQNGPDRRVLATIDRGVNKGNATIQLLSQGSTLTIIDRDTATNTCRCR